MNAGAEWSQGYVTDVSYTNSYFRELSPVWLNHVAAMQGARPRPLAEGFTHIDLGCGLGQTSIVLAGCFPQGRFYGVDFNPAHIDTAQHAAAQIGLGNVTFIERAFEELLDADLPQFDFITLHGIWSWIGESTRQAVARFIYARLKPGGIVYNSYNCLPGWAGDAPIRRLLLELGALHQGDSAARAEKAAKDALELANLKQGYFRAQPAAVEQIAKLPKRQSNYLAHEYLNAAWTTFYSVDVADEMAAAKLTYLGSATLMDNFLELLLADPAGQHVRKQPTERLRQLAQDFLTGQRFRRDVFVRGHPRLPRGETARNLRDRCFALPGSVDDFTEKAKVPRGEITFDAKAMEIIRAAVAQGSVSLAEMVDAAPKGKGPVDIERTLLMLTAVGRLVPTAAPFKPPRTAQQPGKIRVLGDLNRKLVTIARQTMTRQNLVSSQTGVSLPLDAIEAVLLMRLEEGTPPAKLAAVADEELKTRGIRINKDGVPIADAKEAASRMEEIAGRFVSQQLATLIRFGMAKPA
ncbi:MAG TPA: methyltransferase regulatory domain-containing protein [Dongiaceae bacterium]|nr:methyltransferase regulatory domain-containing protein [Dongiaceae bacterium]